MIDKPLIYSHNICVGRFVLLVIFLLCAFLSSIIGCVSAPMDLVQEIYSRPDTAIFKTEAQALKEIRRVERYNNNDKLILDFDKNDSLIMIQGKRAPVKVVEVNHERARFLEVYSVIKSAGWKKDAFVLPKLSFYKNGVLVPEPKVKQIGIDGLCGMDACLVTSYDIGSLPPGDYKIIVAAKVENPDKPLEMRKVDGFSYTGSVPLYMTASRAQYASYFGTVKIQTSEKLPFDTDRKDVQTF